MVSEVGKVLLDAAEKGYSVEVTPYLAGGKSVGLKFYLYDERGDRRLSRIASYDQFRFNRCDPVNYTIREMISLAEYARREAKNNG